MSTLIGCLITATAPRRRTLRGIVLPPAPRSRNGALRITVDGNAPKTFKPDDGWTITVQAGPVYTFGQLPAEHLATRTMLKAEMRLQPADQDKDWIAEYRVRKGTVPLYPVADAVPMPELPAARAEAWTKARTCLYCGKVWPRPLEASPEGDRYCVTCHQEIAAVRWTEQALAAQTEAAAWAREVLAHTGAILLAVDTHPQNAGGVWWHLRAENTMGNVVIDLRIRYGSADDDHEDYTRHPDFWTPERIARDKTSREGTIGRDEARTTLDDLAGRRIIMWRSSSGRAPFPADIETTIPAGDQACERIALWSGWVWGRTGYWYPKPTIPWGHSGNHPAEKAYERSLHHDRPALADKISGLRSLLELMAHTEPPEPVPGVPVIVR